VDGAPREDNLGVVPDELGNVFGDLLHPLGSDSRLEAILS